MWRKEFVSILLHRLEIHPNQEVVDVGCGTGFFTRLVAKGMKGKGRVIGIDRNERLLKVARRLAEEQKLDGTISFRQGNAESMPLRDGSADRVVCQTLLWTLKDPRPAIRDMVRVCKIGGLIGAVEGAFDRIIWYAPDDLRLTELTHRWVDAYTKGYAKLYGSDRGIGYKLPAFFSEVGLNRIRLDGFPFVWLESDDRIPVSFRLQEHHRVIHSHEHPSGKSREESERILRMGGMPAREIEEMTIRLYERSKGIVLNPKLLNRDFSMNAGLYLLTTGLKQE